MNSWFSCDIRKKLKLKILSFYLYQVKAIFICWPVFGSVDRFVLKIEHGFFTMRDIGIVSGQHVTCTKISICLMILSSE